MVLVEVNTLGTVERRAGRVSDPMEEAMAELIGALGLTDARREESWKRVGWSVRSCKILPMVKALDHIKRLMRGSAVVIGRLGRCT